MQNLPINSCALANLSDVYSMRDFSKSNIWCAPLRQAIWRASSPFRLLANGSEPFLSSRSVAPNLNYRK